ncbi:Plasmodium exported protein (PHISTb), unknown function [Plasmodium sp. gorilla clade G2]|uniref:Plasmodium exported protein (PHISTb), unknown function n=1 Tax=Plasmodium sp. gorilla clade G2 TaxID=880535 RepID=UPI000D21BF4A|nr:Plasmodium exported protein (PHISTb), unknown function [Plasmodium sp. gorilla clade G2]SOV19977.1 Plasmodium exported protein (PHISTb), unknown function [Plasmodium sp. gorilla clade G2]
MKNFNEHSVFSNSTYFTKCNKNMNNSFNVKYDKGENEKLKGNKFPRFLVSYFYVLSIVGIIYCLLFNIHTHDNKDEGVTATWNIDTRCLSEGYENLYSPLGDINANLNLREILHGSNNYIPKEFMEWDDEEEKDASQMYAAVDDDDDEEEEEEEEDEEENDDDDEEDEEDTKRKNHKRVPNNTNMKKPNNINKACDNNNNKNKVQQEEKNQNTKSPKNNANKKNVEEEEKHKKVNNTNEKKNNNNNNNNQNKKEKENQGNNNDIPAYQRIDYNNLSVQITLEEFDEVLNSLNTLLSIKEMSNLWNQLRGIERSLFEDTLSDLFTFYHELLETYKFTKEETENIWKECLNNSLHSQSVVETQCNVDYSGFIKKKNLTQEAYKKYITENREEFAKLREQIHHKGENFLNQQFAQYRKEKYGNLDRESKKKNKEEEKERKKKEKEEEKERKKKEKEQEKERKKKEKEQEKERKNKEKKAKENKNKKLK